MLWMVLFLFLSLLAPVNDVFAYGVSPGYYGKGVIHYTENYLRSYSGNDSKFNVPLPYVPTNNLHAAYFNNQGGFSAIKGDRYWYRPTPGSSWTSDTLTNAFGGGPPSLNIDAAYFDNTGGYTVIKGDTYWYRSGGTSGNWTFGSLSSVWGTSSGVPTADIDSAYFDNAGGLTVIDGDRYWYRRTPQENWYTNTLLSAYGSGPPSSNIDAAYFDNAGGYTVIKGDKYWHRTTPQSPWTSSTLASTYVDAAVSGYEFSEFNSRLVTGSDCSRYVDLSQTEINHFKDLGLDFVIVGFGPAAWYNLAPSRPANPRSWQDPTYKFTKLDQWIGKLQHNNINVVLQLWGTPTWASGTPAFAQNNCTQNPYKDFQPYERVPQNLADFADFAEAVMTRYDGQHVVNPSNPSSYLRVNAVALWNEPMEGYFWQSNKTEEFISLNNLAYDRIKSVRPNVDVWGGNLLGNNGLAQNFMNIVGNRLKFDTFALHPYPFDFNASPTAPSNNRDYSVGGIRTFLQSLNINYPGKSVVLAEIGYRSNWERQFNIADTTISESQKATFLQETGSLINEINKDSNYKNKIVGVANNVLYNPWRWWSTGLVNYYNPTTEQIDFNHRVPAFDVFKNWKLSWTVTGSEYTALFRAYSLFDPKADLNYNNKIDALDFATMRTVSLP